MRLVTQNANKNVVYDIKESQIKLQSIYDTEQISSIPYCGQFGITMDQKGRNALNKLDKTYEMFFANLTTSIPGIENSVLDHYVYTTVKLNNRIMAIALSKQISRLREVSVLELLSDDQFIACSLTISAELVRKGYNFDWVSFSQLEGYFKPFKLNLVMIIEIVLVSLGDWVYLSNLS